MYPALVKNHFARTTAFQLTKLSRASVQTKARPDKGAEEFFVTTTFPDDVEGSSIQAEDLLKPTQAVKEPPKVFDKDTTEKHFADIYESILPKEAREATKKANTKEVKAEEEEQEPWLHDM